MLGKENRTIIDKKILLEWMIELSYHMLLTRYDFAKVFSFGGNEKVCGS